MRGILACYGGLVELGRAEWGAVNSFAVRTAHFAECVVEAQSLGHGPGRHRKPWGIGFQREAGPVYAQTLGAGYLRGVADASGYCAGLMDNMSPGGEMADDWEVVATFLRTTADGLLELADVASVATGAGAEEIGSAPPPVLRYELFAELLDTSGVARLQEAAEAVARCCESYLEVVPSAQELEWIVSVAAQEPIAELAERHSTSARGMYRRLEKMWARLGVRNQVQGVALAVERGWIAPPPARAGGSERPARL